MSSPHEDSSGAGHRKYAGVRQRKLGKWVSEIRVPEERLWLGSYSSPEGVAIAHDVAMFCLSGLSASDKLNFPLQRMPSVMGRSVRKVASDARMAVDVSLITTRSREEDGDGSIRISVDNYL